MVDQLWQLFRELLALFVVLTVHSAVLELDSHKLFVLKDLDLVRALSALENEVVGG